MLLEFEEPIAVLLKRSKPRNLPRTDARDREIDQLRRRIQSVRADLYRSLTPWQRVLVARHPNRPALEYFIQNLFKSFTEIHGDRSFADDHAIMTGFAEFRGQPVLIVGHVKGTDTKDKIFRNFGYARPRAIARRWACGLPKSSTGRSGLRRYAGRLSGIESNVKIAEASPSACAT